MTTIRPRASRAWRRAPARHLTGLLMLGFGGGTLLSLAARSLVHSGVGF